MNNYQELIKLSSIWINQIDELKMILKLMKMLFKVLLVIVKS